MVRVHIRRVGRPLKALDLQKVIQTELQKEVTQVKKSYSLTTTTWQHRPRFVVTRRGDYSYEVSTRDKIYEYVDRGTKPHVIQPKTPGYPLRFNSVYEAKTRPGKLTSQAGSSRPPVVAARRVRHPGTKARRFTEEIQKRSQKRFAAQVRAAIRQAVRRR